MSKWVGPGAPAFETEEAEGTLRLRLKGELDLIAATSSIAQSILTRTGPPVNIVVDLHDVTFIDSCGIGFLLQLRRRAEQAGVRMTVVDVSGPAWRTLDAAGLVEYFGATPAQG